MIDEESLKSLENLHRLKGEGIVTDAEFEQAKQRVLFGQQRAIPAATPISNGAPSLDDHLAWMMLPLRRYAEFHGRSSRREFWMFQLVPVAIGVLGTIMVGMSFDEVGDLSVGGGLTIALMVLACLALLVPQLAAQVRRFHDQDKSGWLTLINLVPYVGCFIVLAMMLVEGTKGPNRYGPDPVKR